MNLLFEVTTDTVGAVAKCLGYQCLFIVFGTFAGATVTLEVSPDGTNWIEAGDTMSTEPSLWPLNLAPGVFVRARVAGATASTSVSAYLMV